MKSLPKVLLGTLFVAAFAACGPQKTASSDADSSDSTTIADSVSSELDPDSEYEIPESPKAKSDADQKAVKALWESAIAREKEFLGTPRIEQWVAGLKETEDPESGMPVYGKLEDKQYQSLTVPELVYYAAFHPEYWDQICAEFLYDAGLVQGVSTQLPINVDYLSERQEASIKAKMDSVEMVVLDCIAATQAVSEPMLHLIADFEIKSALPAICDVYKGQSLKDDLILSACIEMMQDAQFKPWQDSELAKEMTGKNRDWIPLTPVNADKIMFYAKKYAAS